METRLSNKETTALKEFRHRISDILDKMDDFQAKDINLLRWLKARDYNVSKAEEMLRKSLQWRESNNIDSILDRETPSYFFDELPHQIAGHDKEGSTVCVVPVGKWDFKRTMELGYKDLYNQYVIQILERGMEYMKQRSLKHNDVNNQVVIIFDFEGFSLSKVMSQMAISALIDNLKMFDANYPEMMKIGFGVNVPKMFEILWAILKPVLAQRTLSKCVFYGCNVEQWRAALTKLIDYRELTSHYGGSNTTHPFYQPEHGMVWPPRAAEFLDKEFTTVIVPAGDKFTKSFQLRPGNVISWNFKTEMYDIGFQVLLDGVLLYPYVKADGHICMQDGLIEVRAAGTYTLIFDNGYSRFRGKTLHYAVRIEENENFIM